MKKRKYLIISAILQIVFYIVAIINAKTYLNDQINSLSSLDGEVYTSFIDFLNRAGDLFIIIPSIIGILISCYILYCSIRNNLALNKTKLIVLLVIDFFTAMDIFQTALIIFNIVIISKIKIYNKKEKKEMPIVDKHSVSLSHILLSVLLFVIYFSDFIWGNFIPKNMGMLIEILFYLFLIVISYFIFRSELKRDVKLLISNFSSYVRFIGKSIGYMYIFYLLAALVSNFITGNNSVNQQNLNSLPLWFVVPAAVIYAPIVEELLFRGSIRRFVKNDILFIVISALSFGFLHTMQEATIFNMIINALPYSVLGGYFAYIYTKTNNLTSSMMCHCFHNAICSLMMILMSV